MIDALLGGVERCVDIFALEVGHLIENPIGIETGREKVKNIRYTNSHSPNARSPTAQLGFD